MRYIFIENDTVVFTLEDVHFNTMSRFSVCYTEAETIHIRIRPITADTLIQRWPDPELCVYCQREQVDSNLLDEAILGSYHS